MTALAQQRMTPNYGDYQKRIEPPVKGGVHIFKGALVVMLAGLAKPGVTGTGLVAVGVALQDADNTNGSDSAIKCLCETGVFKFANSTSTDAISASHVGRPCYIVDDNTVALTSNFGARSLAGRIVQVDSDGVRVHVTAQTQLAAGDWAVGTPLTDTATTTVQSLGPKTSYLLAGTMSQGETITLGTTGAVRGDVIRLIRTSTSAQTAAVVNGGVGAGTLVTLPASKVNFAEAMFDGTNWLFQACGTQ